MNELRPCAPLSLKHVLAQELVKGLQFGADSLLRYNTTQVLGENELGLFLLLCRAFIEVAYPHCATCFGRCFPGGTSLIMDAKKLHNGISHLLAASCMRELPKSVNNGEAKSMAENGDAPVVELGRTSEAEETEATNADEKRRTDQTDTNLENPAWIVTF